MRFHMMETGPELIADGLQANELVDNKTADLLRLYSSSQHIHPSEISSVRIRRMRPDGYMMTQCQLYGPAHRIHISGMIAAGNISRTYVRENCLVRIHTLAHVAIQVDQHTSSF